MNGGTLMITGIHGLVGQYLFKILDQWPGKLVITGKGPCRLPFSSAIYEEMDITDPVRIQKVFTTHLPDVVIHTAAMAQPDQCELNREVALKVNTEGTSNLLEAAAQYKSFFIYLSTDFVFSGEDGPCHEESAPAPVNYYGVTKWMAEEKVKAYTHEWAIVRTVLVYGNMIAGTRSNIISWIKGELEQNRKINVVSDQLRTTTYAGDLAKMLLKLAGKRSTGIWHISGKDPLTPYDIAIKLAGHLGLDKNLIHPVDASSFSQPAQRPLKTPFDISKARRFLEYEPVSFEEGMKLVLNGD